MGEKVKENLLNENFQSTNYLTTEERMSIHHEICQNLGEDLNPETYVRFCRKNNIEIPIMPPAYGWEV